MFSFWLYTRRNVFLRYMYQRSSHSRTSSPMQNVNYAQLLSPKPAMPPKKNLDIEPNPTKRLMM